MSAFPWVNSYPKGVRWDCELPTSHVDQLLVEAAGRWPDQPALDFMGKKSSYRELDRLVSRAAEGFQALGVRPGVHVGLYLPNTPHYVISFFGVLRAGGTVVNYSPLDAERVLEHKIEDSRTDVMVTLDLKALYPQMAGLLGKTRLRSLVVGNIGEMTPAPEAVAQRQASAGETVELAADGRVSTFAQLLENQGEPERHAIGDPAETIAVLQYTGGTTGTPKGAMLTHANLTAACSQYWAMLNGDEAVLELGRERVLAVLPLFHIYALTVNMLLGIRLGAEIILHPRFELDAVLRDLSTKRPSMFPGVPTMYTAIVAAPGIDKLDLTSLKFCASGGAPLPVELQQSFERLTGCKLVEGWGMTETAPSGTTTPVFGQRKAGSCGMPMPGIVIKIVDPADPAKEMPLGDIGEICVSGPNVMKGYWNKPEATAAMLTPDGFLRSGDIGYMDEDGFVFIVDRAKDMILCGGYNVYPRNIEEAIYEHPAVAEAAVIGVSDPYRGQSPKAFITLKAGATPITLEELQEFLKSRLGKHEMVQAMELRRELPKTPVGKLSKKELYEEEERRTAG